MSEFFHESFEEASLRVLSVGSVGSVGIQSWMPSVQFDEAKLGCQVTKEQSVDFVRHFSHLARMMEEGSASRSDSLPPPGPGPEPPAPADSSTLHTPIKE